MEFKVMKCPVCGAALEVERGSRYLVCSACDTPLMMNDDQHLFRADEAEEIGYRFEKGRQRAQSEQNTFHQGSGRDGGGEFRMEDSGDFHMHSGRGEWAPGPNPTPVPPRYTDSSGYQTYRLHGWDTYAQPYQQVSEKDWTVAMLLCVFLGMYGGHHYYMGNIRKGLLYTFTAGLLGIGWIIDIVKLATGNFRDRYGFPVVNQKSYYTQRNFPGATGYNGNNGTGSHRTAAPQGNPGYYEDPEAARERSNANKRRAFFILGIIGAIGMFGALGDGEIGGVFVGLVWAGVCFYLWYKTPKPMG